MATHDTLYYGTEKILFEVPFNVHMILEEFDAETLDHIPDRQSPYHFFFKGFITNKLTRIFVSFRVIHELLSLILSTEQRWIRFLTHGLIGIL